MEASRNTFHGVVQDEHIDYMNFDWDTDLVSILQNNKNNSKDNPLESSSVSPPSPHPKQISRATHEIQAGSNKSNISQSENTPMENYNQMSEYNANYTLVNLESIGEIANHFRLLCGSVDEHYLRVSSELHPLDQYRLPILKLLAEIKETIPGDHRQERKSRKQHGYKSIDWERVLHRAYLAVQALLDARFEKLHGNYFKRQDVECARGNNELSDILNLHSEGNLASMGATEGPEVQHKLIIDSDNDSSSDPQIPVQKKLFLIIDKSGTASLKTNDLALFSRLSRRIDLKRGADTELNPSNKRRCTGYQMGMLGAVANQAICLLLSDDPSYGKMEYPYTYLALNQDVAVANEGVAAVGATSSELVRLVNPGSHKTCERLLRNTAGGPTSKASVHSDGSSCWVNKAGVNSEEGHRAKNLSETSLADSKGKNSTPTSDEKHSASIKKLIAPTAESEKDYPVSIEEFRAKLTAGKHHTRSGMSFWECVFDLVTFIIALLFYGFVAYAFYKLNLHLILL